MKDSRKESPNFRSTYASTYDILYREKNYEDECAFIEEIFHRFGKHPVKSILDLGCGTGGHAIPFLRRGYSVCGIDRSSEMIEIARQKARAQGLSDRARFETGSIQDIHVGKIFDAVICMFAVIGYQTSNKDLFAAIQTVRNHLEPDGLFICDFWYGPAVLAERPTARIKTIHEGEERIIRIAQPKLDDRQNMVTITYHLLRLRGMQLLEESQEIHQMRYLFRPELEFFFSQAGMHLLHFCPFMKLDEPAGERTWNAVGVAQAI